MDQALSAKMTGFSNSRTMPIKARIDMLSTDIRTPVGVMVFGPDLAAIARILSEVETAVGMVPGTRNVF
jgi:Cu(I)/Ag(I) efflux system membrane protein CusA/SilA